MSIVVRIAGEPARSYYRDDRALLMIASGEARHPLLLSTGPLRSGPGENANVSIELDNVGGEISGQWAARPPLGAAVTITASGVEVFAGNVQRVSLGSSVTIEAEA